MIPTLTTVTTDDLILETKRNIFQLLNIGLCNYEQIERHFGSEYHLLNLIKGYNELLKDLEERKESEE
jgi:hypothetical protein